MVNIDHLIQLGKEGRLDELEKIRKEAFESLLAQVTDEDQRRRLCATHWKCQTLQHKYKNPAMAAAMAFEMMMESLAQLRDALKSDER